jgi:hypothetical protein
MTGGLRRYFRGEEAVYRGRQGHLQLCAKQRLQGRVSQSVSNIVERASDTLFKRPSLTRNNSAMHYICGKGCPAGTGCTNGSLYLRSQKKTKVVFTGSRGFGLKILEKVDEGEFIMDYRGEIIGLE